MRIVVYWDVNGLIVLLAYHEFILVHESQNSKLLDSGLLFPSFFTSIFMYPVDHLDFLPPL